MQGLNDSSEVFRAVNEELELFLSKVRERIKAISSSLNSDRGADADILGAISQRFGYPNARSCLSFIRGPSGWNGFQHDNFNRKQAELMEIDTNGGHNILYSLSL